MGMLFFWLSRNSEGWEEDTVASSILLIRLGFVFSRGPARSIIRRVGHWQARPIPKRRRARVSKHFSKHKPIRISVLN